MEVRNSNKELKIEYVNGVPALIGGNIIINQCGAGFYGQKHVVLSKLRHLLSLNISNFNGRLEESIKRDLICFDEFKKLHQNELTKKGNRTMDCVVANFKDVDTIKSDETGDIIGYSFKYNGCLFNVFFSGRLIRETTNKRIEICGLQLNNTWKNIDKGWVRFNLFGQSFKCERLIGVLGCIYTNLMPTSFFRWYVNVMDCTGSLESCAKFKTIPDYRPENLEWSLRTANSVHGNIVHNIFEKTGNLYRISAYDKEFLEYYDTHNIKEVDIYCKNHFLKVR